jgi:hypothetical protein
VTVVAGMQGAATYYSSTTTNFDLVVVGGFEENLNLQQKEWGKQKKKERKELEYLKKTVGIC